MRKITNSLYVKYLISYVIAFVIPLIILGAIMFLSFSNLLKNEISRYTAEILTSSQTTIDSRIEEMNNTAIQVSGNPQLNDSEIYADFFNTVSTVNTLNNIARTNQFYEDIFIYYQNSDLIYGASGTYRTDYFLKSIFMFEKWNTEDFINDMNKLSGSIVRPAEKVTISGVRGPEKKWVTYIVPLPYGSKKPTGAVIFMINENNFGSSLQKILNIQEGNVVMLSPQGQPVVSYGNMKGFDLTQILSKVLQEKDTSFRQFIQNKLCSISGLRSDLTGWTYIVFFPVSIVYEKMKPMLLIVFIGFAAVVSVGFIVIRLLTRANYRPIQDLVHFALDAFNEPSLTKDANEIETVKTTVNKMTGVIHSLQKKVESTIPDKRDLILKKLVKGYYSAFEAFQAEAYEAGIVLSGSSSGVVVFIVHNGENTAHTTAAEIIEAHSSDPIQICCIEGMDQNRIVSVFFTEPEYLDSLGSYVTSLVSILKDEYRLEITAGIGTPVQDMKSLGNSYLEASAALDYRFIKGKNTVILYSELGTQNNNQDYFPKDKLATLKLCVLKGDSEGVINILSEFFNEIKSLKLPVFYVRSLSYHLINFVFDSIYHLQIGLDLREYKYSDITALARLETIDELSIQIAKFCTLACSMVVESKDESSRSKVDQIRKYILQNYNCADFSLQTIADHFSMSVSGLSNYFKFNTGENISDCVNHLRIERAKQLLLETDQSLQSIVNQIGYINVSSFIRKFREHTGTTPGDYRSVVKKKA